MSTSASRRHPEPDELAAFIEGGLEGADLMSVTEHLSDCMECRALLRDAAALSREEVRAATPRKMSAPWWLAAAAAIVIVAGAIWMIRLQAQHDPMQQLIAAAPTGHRELEVRLSGFAWAPLRVMRGSGEPADTDQMRLTGAAGQVLQEARNSTSPESRHAAGVAQLLTEHRDDAIRELEAAARASNDAHVWNDLAAARYAAAMRDDSPEQLKGALTAADKALALEHELPEALFNRALILQRLGLVQPATDAWKQYLAVDPKSQWADEAREHLATLSRPRASFRDELDRRYAKLASGDAEAARELVVSFPQEARTWGEAEILGRWAADGSARHLAVARALGAALAERSGETMLADAVVAIDGGDTRLRDAHRIYREARIAYSKQQPSVAEPLLRKAAELFAAARSPMAQTARYFAACAAFDQDRRDEAKAQLEPLLASLAPSHHALRAHVQWELGLCHGAETRWTRSLEALNESHELFTQLGERTNAASVDVITADVLEALGDSSEAWRHRIAAMPIVSAEQNTRGLTALAAATRNAIHDGDWDAADSLLRIEIAAARAIDHKQLLADAMERRALVDFRRGVTDDALRSLREADAVTASIADAPTREREQVDRAAAAAIIVPSNAEGIDRAIDFHRTRGRRDLLPSLLLSRARMHRARGENEAASRVLAEAFAEVEQQRAAAPPGGLRWSIFDASQEVVAESVDLLVARGDPAGALALADRARSRVLLDTLSSTPPARLPASLPAGTALLEYVWLDDRLVVFAADRSGVTAVKIAANRLTIETLVATYRSSLARGDATSGAQLHALLIAPIAQRIARQPTLVVVPDGALHGVAFSALFDPQSRRYLIEDHAVIVAPSAAVYSEALKRRETRVSASELLLVAQPRRGDVPLDTGEAEEITPLYAKVTRLTGAVASRAALTRDVIDANVLHFAGHGITDARAGSALLLASSAGDSGIVDTRDIAALSLPVARTVVLAACSTAAARARSGREGVDSVARAFLAAGAPSVIATLWPIDDRLAAPMFVRIHRRLARGVSAADAVREAQLDAIRGAAPLPPSIWAAIQTIGS
jgi:CHAT domain-containing protein/tetratricopeptide (TPR) repeat protein